MTLQEHNNNNELELVKKITISQTAYINTLEEKINKQSEALKVAREALEFYATANCSQIKQDDARLAIKALATIEQMEA